MDLLEAARLALGLQAPWTIVAARLEGEGPSAEVFVEVKHDGSRSACPTCSKESPGYDSTPSRTWRHLDMWEFKTWIEACVPRIECEEHGIQQIPVPWAEVRSRFSAPFESRVIDWLQEASIGAVARNMGISWSAAAGIQQRAVERGLARRPRLGMTRIGVDETSFQKRHEYVTIVNDLETGHVLYVADDRKQTSLEGFFEGLERDQLAAIDIVAMDMHAPYITAAGLHVPDLERKIAFDRFHVAQSFGRAVDQVRREENRELVATGDDRLKGSKYLFLKSPRDLARAAKDRFNELRDSSLRTSKAWAIKDAASRLWHYRSATWATKQWRALCDWGSSTGLVPIQRACASARYHLIGIVNAIVNRVSNASAEGINSRVQMLKRRAHGYRNRPRFRDAILFHLGGLDLYPKPSTHTNR